MSQRRRDRGDEPAATADSGSSHGQDAETDTNVGANPAEPAPGSGLTGEIDSDASGRRAFVQALRVRRNTTWGVAIGTGVALVVFVVFVVLPATIRSPLWYVGLAFVLALSVAGLVATVLTLVRAIRLSRSL